MKYHSTQESSIFPFEYYTELELLGVETHNKQPHLMPWESTPEHRHRQNRPIKPRSSKWSQSKRQQFRNNLVQLKKEFDFLVDSDRKSQDPDNTKIQKFPTESKSPNKIQKKLSIIDCTTVEVLTNIKPFKPRTNLRRKKDNISQISIKTPSHSPRYQSRLIHSSLQPYENGASPPQKFPRKQSIEYLKKKQWDSLHKRVRSLTQSPEKDKSSYRIPRYSKNNGILPTDLTPSISAFSRQKQLKPSINGKYIHSYLFNRIRQ